MSKFSTQFMKLPTNKVSKKSLSKHFISKKMNIFFVVIFLIHSCLSQNNQEQRIHYGNTVHRRLDAPFMAALFRTPLIGEREYICGGTIISHQHVLTSGYCVL